MKTDSWKLPKFKIDELKKKSSDYCICIPIINEGERIRKQLQRMKALTKIADILICDGGSTDGSTKLKDLRRFKVRTLLTKISPGRQATQLRMGFSYALKQGYKVVVQVDGNNKDGVNAIPKFIKKIESGYDYVQGSRFIKGGKGINTPFKRYFGVRFIASPILSLAARYWYTDVTNGFRAYSAKYLLNPKVKPFREIFVSYSLNFYLTVRCNQIGLKSKELPVLRKYPKTHIPTKMNKISGELNLLKEVILTTIGKYNP